MTGGNYHTWFDSRDAESRKILYLLENKGIVKLNQEKEEKPGWYKYEWQLTQKGEDIVKTNNDLQNLWKHGKIQEFYKRINLILDSED